MSKTKLSTVGSFAYRNLLRVKEGASSEVTREFPCYTDARIIGETRSGPFLLLNPVRISPAPEVAAVVIRIDDHTPQTITGQETLPDEGNEHYHGGAISDEIAAITSLELGIRLKAGAANREFALGEDEDPLGRPIAHGRFGLDEPKAPGGLWKPIIPSLRRDAILSTRILDGLVDLGPHDSVILTRCARLYQDAVWIADSTPELSWLLLVSAVETAANHWQVGGDADPYETVRSADTPLVGAIRDEEGGEELLRRLAPHLAVFTGARKKFVGFLLTFGPHASAAPQPDQPDTNAWGYLDWSPDSLARIYRKVYDLRSNALHSGHPFPYPMCVPPRDFGGRGLEVPVVTGAWGSTWKPGETPLLLSTFERMAREAIVSYFLSLGRKSSAA